MQNHHTKPAPEQSLACDYCGDTTDTDLIELDDGLEVCFDCDAIFTTAINTPTY